MKDGLSIFQLGAGPRGNGALAEALIVSGGRWERCGRKASALDIGVPRAPGTFSLDPGILSSDALTEVKALFSHDEAGLADGS